MVSLLLFWFIHSQAIFYFSKAWLTRSELSVKPNSIIGTLEDEENYKTIDRYLSIHSI